MLKKNAKVELLRRVPLFSECSKSQLGQIATITDEIEFSAGQTLIREGERGRQFFVVVEGDVQVTKRGRKVPVRGGAEFFGEIALLSDTPTNASVTTTSPVRALVVSDRGFRRLTDEVPGIRLKILQALAGRLAPDTI